MNMCSDTSWLPESHPGARREFTRYSVDGEEVSTSRDPLFGLKVKRVCAKCNNEWMNNLDSLVEPWIFDPYKQTCDPVQFRRWAIKVAILRTFKDDRALIHIADLDELYRGSDMLCWRIFIGRTRLPEHRHSFAGFGASGGENGGFNWGITEVSWTLQHVYVGAVRLSHPEHEVTKALFKRFKKYLRHEGSLLAEVMQTAKAEHACPSPLSLSAGRGRCRRDEPPKPDPPSGVRLAAPAAVASPTIWYVEIGDGQIYRAALLQPV